MITNLFGTDGIRKAVGLSPFTVHELPLLGFAIGTWLTNKYGTHTHMVLAHDTRESSHFIKSALKTGVLI
jgi:phosphomannomutase